MDKYLSLRLLTGLAVLTSNRPWVANSGYIFATTLVGSVLGFVFWTAASHLCSPAQIGLGASLISAITLIAALGDMGLGVMLVRYSSSFGREQIAFFNTLLLVVASCTLALTLVFIAGVPWWSPALNGMLASRSGLSIFVVGALAFASALFYDRLFIARQATRWMFWRSLLMHVSRLILLLAFLRGLGATGLLAAVGLGALISLAVSVWAFSPRALPGYHLRLTLNMAYLSGRMGYALGNHLSQLTWGLPPLIYPLLVAGMLGAEANAHFYTSWMVANLLFMIPLAVSTASFATASFATASSSAALHLGPFWRAMCLTLLGLLPVTMAFMLFTRPVMQLFGDSYSANYRLLVLFLASVFPYTINTFVITAYRLGSHIRGLVCLSVSIAGLSLGLVAVLCGYLGLLGIGWGWLLAQTTGVLLACLGYLTSLRGRPPAQ